jgi:hypothetical protein
LAPIGSLITLPQKNNNMKKFGLFNKNSNESINQIRFNSLAEAILFFAQQKRLMINAFNDLFDVREI